MDNPVAGFPVMGGIQMPKDRIMIVEDEVVVSADIRDKLTKLGYDACPIVRYGEEVLEEAEKNKPDLILMDIKLKGETDGVEAARRIKEHLNIPIVFVTAYSGEETLDRAKACEPFGYLKKPLRIEDMKITLEMGLYKAKMERKLRESEEKYRFLAEHSADIIYRLNIKENRFTYVSPSAERILGYSPEDCLSLKAEDVLTPDSYAKQINTMLAAVKNGRKEPEILQLEALHRDGNILPVEVHAILIVDEQGSPVEILGVARDITVRRREEDKRIELERRIKKLQKAESMGRMAGAVAHHCNNLMSVIIGNLELALDEIPFNSVHRSYIASAMNASRRVAEISQLLLSYLGQSIGKREPIDLSEICRDVLSHLGDSLPPKVGLTTDLPEKGPAVLGDAAQIGRSITNILVNAGEAIGEGIGNITVAISRMTTSDIPKSQVYPADWEPKEYVYACVSVTDTGCGMDMETMEKVFDPFFSTKFTGRGLGLPVALGLVKAHDGAVRVESKPGQGTTLQVFLPLFGDNILQTQNEKPVAKVGSSGGVTQDPAGYPLHPCKRR